MLSRKMLIMIVVVLVLSLCQDIFRASLFFTSLAVTEVNVRTGYTIASVIFPQIFTVYYSICQFNTYWKLNLQQTYLDVSTNCSGRNVCKFVCKILGTILLFIWLMIQAQIFFFVWSFHFHSCIIYNVFRKWSICSNDTNTNAYNCKLFEYITADNKYYRFKKAKNKIIAINYYILSVIKDKINNYPKKQQENDNRFLQKVSILHENSGINSADNQIKYLWNVEWNYFEEHNRCNKVFIRASCRFVWFLGFSLYVSMIGLIVNTYLTQYNGVIVLPLFFLLEFIDIISLFFNRRIWLLSYWILPNINIYSQNVQNSKVEIIWNSDVLDVTEDEMIRRIQIIYNIMFVEAKGIQTLYKINKYTGTPIASIISDYAWTPLPYSLETDDESIDMNEGYVSLSTTEMIQNSDIDLDYLSFIFDEESEGAHNDEDDYRIALEDELKRIHRNLLHRHRETSFDG